MSYDKPEIPEVIRNAEGGVATYGSEALRDVVRERIRQVDVEGFGAARDDKYEQGEMSAAAAAYAFKTASGHSMLQVALAAVFAACEAKGLKLTRREAVVSQMPDARLPMPVDTFCERMNSAADFWRKMHDRAPNFAAFELERRA